LNGDAEAILLSAKQSDALKTPQNV